MRGAALFADVDNSFQSAECGSTPSGRGSGQPWPHKGSARSVATDASPHKSAAQTCRPQLSPPRSVSAKCQLQDGPDAGWRSSTFIQELHSGHSILTPLLALTTPAWMLRCWAA